MTIWLLRLLFLAPIFAALVWGGKPERWGAALFAVAGMASAALQRPGPTSWMVVQSGVLMVDVLLLSALLVLIYRYNRWWLIFATAFHLISVLGHLGRWLDVRFDHLAYALMESASTFPAVTALGIGTWLHWRRQKRANGTSAKS